MFTNRLFHLLILAAILVPTACAPQAEVTSTATSIPAATLTPTAEPTVIPTATSQPMEAAINIAANLPFPTGKFLHPNDPLRYFLFTEEGEWSHWYDTTQLARGTYSVENNIYIQTSNSGGCPVPKSYEYTFDGKSLTFQLTAESNNDTCGGRKNLYNNKTYILSP